MGNHDLKNMVSVYGPGITKPLLRSNDVRLIQIRDENGDIEALFFKITKTLWGFTARGDADWNDHLRHLEIDDSKI